MRVLIGQDARDFEGMKSALSLAEKKLDTAVKNEANARHGWITASAELSDVQEAFDQLSAEMLDLQLELARVRQSERMFKQAFVTLGAKFLERAPEYAAVES